jgi:hypothetical protein
MTQGQGIGHETVDGGEALLTSTHRAGRKVPFLTVGGIDEREIFAYAPTMQCDRVHWDTVEQFDARTLLSDLPMTAYTRQWSDGQHRIWVPAGEGFAAREAIKTWCVAHDVDAVNVRVEAGVPFRNLELIPEPLLPELIAAAVEWLYPRSYVIRKKIVTYLDLVDDDDVRSLMYLFVSDHADRFDGGREGRNGTLNLLAFMIGKLRTWPQDAARTAYGRAAMGDRVTLSRASDSVAATEQRAASPVELAAALGTSVTDLRRREHAIAVLASMRHPQALAMGPGDPDGFDAVQLASETDVEEDALSYGRSAELTSAIMAAVVDSSARSRHAQDPLALAAVYLSFWEGLSRAEVARELNVLPKTATAAVGRVLSHVQSADIL